MAPSDQSFLMAQWLLDSMNAEYGCVFETSLTLEDGEYLCKVLWFDPGDVVNVNTINARSTLGFFEAVEMAVREFLSQQQDMDMATTETETETETAA
jgi:hypothetical protein